jgi:hypothetical protein
MIIEAMMFVALAALFIGMLRLRLRTGSLTGSPNPGYGTGRTTRERHSVFFWLWNVQIIGATVLLTGLAVLCVTDTVGLTNFFDGVEVEDAAR